MLANVQEKQICCLKDGVLEIFGHKGYVEDGAWYMNLLFGVAFTAVEPEPASPEIEAVIAGDIEDGNWDKIDHIVISPNLAVRLYLEGRLKVDHFFEAEGTESSVTIKQVMLEGKDGMHPFTVVVKDVAFNIATMDSEGKII